MKHLEIGHLDDFQKNTKLGIWVLGYWSQLGADLIEWS